jgi:hypothetical protein
MNTTASWCRKPVFVLTLRESCSGHYRAEQWTPYIIVTTIQNTQTRSVKKSRVS